LTDHHEFRREVVTPLTFANMAQKKAGWIQSGRLAIFRPVKKWAVNKHFLARRQSACRHSAPGGLPNLRNFSAPTLALANWRVKLG